MSESIIQQLEELGVFPIVVIDDPDDAEPLGAALLEAGMPCAEVTFRTPAAADAIGKLGRCFPQLLLGAGTVLKIDQAKKAKDLGVRFILSPGFNPKVVDYCLSEGLTVFPGVCTPTEIEAAMDHGLTVLKFFPAEAMGGLPYLKAISAPLSMVRYLPTGGVNLQNLPAYLDFKQTLACAGTWIVRKEWLKQKRFDLIGKEAAQSLDVVRTVRKGGMHA
jgi:Entner-Doudoroff aldolase